MPKTTKPAKTSRSVLKPEDRARKTEFSQLLEGNRIGVEEISQVLRLSQATVTGLLFDPYEAPSAKVIETARKYAEARQEEAKEAIEEAFQQELAAFREKVKGQAREIALQMASGVRKHEFEAVAEEAIQAAYQDELTKFREKASRQAKQVALKMVETIRKEEFERIEKEAYEEELARVRPAVMESVRLQAGRKGGVIDKAKSRASTDARREAEEALLAEIMKNAPRLKLAPNVLRLRVAVNAVLDIEEKMQGGKGDIALVDAYVEAFKRLRGAVVSGRGDETE
jgi:hypothetical protein